MRETRICPAPAPAAPSSPYLQVQEDYARYLSQDIGLSARTLEHYTGVLVPFLQAQVGADGPNWSALTSTQIRKFFEGCARRRSPQRLQLLRTALRSFLRYLQCRGAIRIDLSNCIPRAPRRRLVGLPRYLSPHQLRLLLNNCDRKTAVVNIGRVIDDQSTPAST